MRTPRFPDGDPPQAARATDGPTATQAALRRAMTPVTASLVLCSGLLWTDHIAAQSTGSSACSAGGVTVELLAIGDDDEITGTEARNPNRQECESEATLSFQLTMVPEAQNLVLYVGDEGANCQDENVRDNPDNAVDDCNGIGNVTLSTEARVEVDVPLGNLLCTSGEQTIRRLFFFPASGSDVSTTPTTYGCYDLTVDADPPAAPTDLNAPQGENVLTLSWEPVGDSTIQEYVAFYDDRSDRQAAAASSDDEDGGISDLGTGNPDCPSSIIVQGAELDPSSLPSGIGDRSVTGMVASSVDISTGNISSEVLPVAVAARDQAGNLGPLSEVVCMRIVETTGFWDEYEAAGGDAQGGCACGVTGTRDRGAVAGAIAPIALALLGLGRRTRRRRA